jgi:hypothetical protein
MIAAVQNATGYCAVQVVGRQGLSVMAKTYCNRMVSAAEGVFQIPDRAMNCEGCKRGIKTLEASIK